jgi:hypothetical protein
VISIVRGGQFNSDPGQTYGTAQALFGDCCGNPLGGPCGAQCSPFFVSTLVCSSWDRKIVSISTSRSNDLIGVGMRLVYGGSEPKDGFVLVEDTGNENDITWTNLRRTAYSGGVISRVIPGAPWFNESEFFGKVDDVYQIAKYPVTVCEYVEFLNAAAKSNTGAYDITMSGAGVRVTRSGRSGSYLYSFDPRYGNKPMQRVSFVNFVKYCNWLSYGKPNLPPLSGASDVDITIGRDRLNERIGVYVLRPRNSSSGPFLEYNSDFATGISGDRLSAALPNNHEFPDSNNQYLIPNEDQWYKAAFYNPLTQEYNRYATQRQTDQDIPEVNFRPSEPPTPVFALGNGDGSLNQENPVQETTFEC